MRNFIKIEEKYFKLYRYITKNLIEILNQIFILLETLIFVQNLSLDFI